MKPMFTIHAGEYLVGSYIERKFKRVNVWVPSRDTGVDLLVSDRDNRRAVSLQVKFSRDYLVTHNQPEFQKQLRACGFCTINRSKLRASRADYWVFVLPGFDFRTLDFVVVPTKELQQRLRSIHRSGPTIRTYPWVTKRRQCWETRGLRKAQLLQIRDGDYRDAPRDFTKWLNTWPTAVKQLNA
jgi:hypothetical protein